MQEKKLLVDKIYSFIQRDKFSKAEWNKRGLNSSSQELCARLTFYFNSSATQLVDAVKLNATTDQLVAIIHNSLFALNKNDYDTEEREFIGDLFFELAGNVDVDLGEVLDEWQHGSKVISLMNRNRNIIETLSQPCTRCETSLETYITKKENGIPDTDWFIVKCYNCNELNLLTLKPDILELRFGNYKEVAILRKAEYSHEQALAKLFELKSGLRKV